MMSNPQWKSICLQLTTKSPKKPNSANRRIARVNFTKLTKAVSFSIKIPGESHSLQQHSTILVRSGRVRDLIGVGHIAIRGKFDLSGVKHRKTSRSIYGVKLLKEAS